MKRRLSIAISVIGGPQVLILDEPTTGMDPKTRRFVWQLIQDLRKGRVVIMTTHSMEEADALSDRIVVFAKGGTRCVGTPLYLKNNFGDGYRVTLISQPGKLLFMRMLAAEILPSAKLLDETGEQLTLALPLSKIDEIREFFRFPF